MRHFLRLILLVALGTTLNAQNDSVTFKVDMNDYTGSFTTVNLNGTFNGWCGGCNAMSDSDGDGVWEVLLPLTADTIEYKFTLDGWTNQENFAGGEPCTVTNFGFTNRELIFTDDTVLPVVCYNSCNACTGVILNTVDFPITWDDAMVNYSTGSFGGNSDSVKVDPTDATNMVLKLDKGAGAQTWAGTTMSIGGLANPVPFTMGGANTISVRFWSPDAGAAVLLKVEDQTNAGIFVETTDTTTVAGGWEVLTFDFNNPGPNAQAINTANTYDIISIFPNFGVDGATAGAKTYYVDDVVYGTLSTGMSGIYTINASAAASSTNYTSFSAAAADLVSLGVVGACTFNVAPASYTDTVYLPAIMGTSAANTITFDGGDSATTTLAYDNTASNQREVIMMDGADYVSFKNLTITHDGTLDSWGVRMTNDNDNFMLDACRIVMGTTTSTSELTCIGSSSTATSQYGETDAGDNITIQNSAFVNGSFGIHFEVSSFDDSNFVAMNNTMMNNYYRYYMSDNAYDVTLSGNTASGMTYSTGYGFAIYDMVGLEMTGNEVNAPYYGAYITDLNFDGNSPRTSLIANNSFISSGATGQEGFYCDDCDTVNVYYNSFVTNSSSTSAYGGYFNDPRGVDVRNNLFYGTSNYAAYFSDNTTTTGTTSSPVNLDYNAYYTVNGASLAYDAGVQSDLATWQANRAGNNTNSVSGDPILINPASDVHVAGAILNGAATPIASITMDIDGDMRDATTPDIGSDEYTPASCLPVGTFTTIMAYADSATVAWADPNGSGTVFNIEYGLAGFTPGTGTTMMAHPDTFLTITGLTANTNYEFYVTADCGAGGIASQSGPGAFSTTLAAPRVITCTTGISGSLFTEDFDNTTTFTGNIAGGNGTWVYDNNNTGSSNTGPSGPQSGSHYIFVETSSGAATAAMVSPAVDLSAASQNVELTFWLHAYGATIGVLDVGVSTSASGPFTNVFSYGPGQLQTDELDPWQQVGINLDAYLGQTIYIEFFYTRGSSFTSDLAIDLVEVNTCLSCLTPSSLASANVTATSADISWTSGASNQGSTIEYGPSGFMPGTGLIATSTTGMVTLSSLMSATAYDVYVTDSCGAGDISGAAGPITFTTLCAPSFPAPYSTNFENITLGNQASYENCWTTNLGSNPRWESEDASGSNENSSLTGPTVDNTVGVGGTYMFLETSSPSSLGDTNVLYSPLIDISSLTVPQIEFYYHMFGQTMGNLYVYAEDAAGTRTILDSIIGQQQAAQTDPWMVKTITPTLASGSYRFVFVGEAGSSFYSDMSIDDFSVSQAPTCFAPTALSVISTDNNSAEVTWMPGNASNWLIEYGPTGFMPGSGTMMVATNDTATISGLSAATGYDFYVADSCAVGDVSTFTGPVSFFTSACAASSQCTFTLDLTDTWGDGWNGNEITIWQAGIPVGTYGAGFTTGNNFPTINVDLCDGLPTYVTLSTQGGFTTEIGFTLTNPLNDTQGEHVAGASLAQGDTLASFTTDCSACGPIVAPFYESFDGTSTPLCFTQSAGAGGPWLFSTNANSVQCAALSDNTGNGGNYAWMDQSSSDDSVSLELPVIDVSALTTPFLEFYYAMCGVGYSPVNITIREYWDGTSWITADTIAIATNGWQKFEDTIPAAFTYNNGLFRMRFRAESGGSGSDFYGDNAIDDIRIYEAPSCFAPSNLGATNITSSTADVFWTTGGSSNWILEYGPAGFVPGTGTVMNVTNDTIMLSSLMSATAYDFYVQDSCAVGDVSLPTGPFTFTTSCPASFAAPYSTDFESITLGNQASYENCWTTNVSGNPRWESEDATGFNENSSGTGPTVDNTVGVGGTYMFLETSSPSSLGDTNVLYSPAIDISTLTTPMLSFYYHMHGQTMGNLRIWAETSAGTRIALDSIVGQQQLAQTDPWMEKQVLLSGLAAGTYRFLLEGVAGSSFYSDMSIDDFSVVEAPSCFASSNLSVISSDNNSALVTWTAGTGTSWDVEYGPAGFSPGSGTVINSTNDTLNITGLMASTAYDFYVTDSCGSANGVALTAGPASFTTTACAASEQCLYYFDLLDTFGDGWNGATITVWQNGVAVGTLGSNFSTGSVFNDSLTLCDNIPTYVTLSAAGGFPSEVGLVVIQPNGDTVGVHTASGTTAAGDTLASFTSSCSSCGTYVAPFFESFELSSASIACWTNEAISDTSLVWSLGSGSTGGAVSAPYAGALNAVFVSQGPSGSGDTTRLVSPVIDLSALINPQLSFWYAQENWFGDQNITNVYYRAAATDPWTFLWGDNSSVNSWTQAIMSLPNPSGSYQIAIEGINNWGHANVVDSLSITDAAIICSLPDSVQANNITATNADISWVSGTNASSSWIEYGLAGFAPGSGTIVNPATSVTTLSGLMPGTLYEACVYDICSTLGDTSMAACVTFATLCAPVNTYPYLEDFEAGIIPPCYSETATGSSYTWRPGAGGTPSTNTGPAVDHTTGTGAGTFLFVEASSPAATGDSAFLWTAEFDMTSLTNPEIVYYYHMYGADIVNLDFQAYDRTSMNWVSLNNIVGQQQFANGDAWGEARVNLAAYTTDTALQLRFLSVRGASFDGDAALDDIIIRETPPCVDASNLMVTTAGNNSVSLSWMSDTNIVSSTIQYGAPGFALGTGTNVTATPGGFTVTGLANTTCYDFYVMDSCSAATNWVGPVTACTIASCSVSTMPSGTTNDTTDCDGSSVTVMATSSTSNDLAWMINGVVRETGDTYVTDSISFTTAFDVAEYVTTSPSLSVGPLTNIATAGYGNFSNGQYLTVVDTIHIDSMTVNHSGDVIAFAQIWDAAITNVLQRGDTFSTPAGVTGDMRVPVNMVLTPGVYFINVDFIGGTGSLFRATGGAAYPYDLPGLMSIDSTNFASQVRIYYTFDMSVSKACIGMPAQALGVVPGANAGISDTSLVCSSDAAANLASFLGVYDTGGTWVDNDATGALTDSILDATQLMAGNIYHFSYIVAGVNGCTGDTANVYAEIEAAPFGGVDTSVALCAGSGITILRNYLTGTAFGGDWVDLDGSGALNVNTGVFNSNNASSGTYRVLYVLAGVACPADTTMLTLNIDTVVSAGIAVSDSVCDDESMVDLNSFLDASASAGGMWTDLSGSGALSGNMFDATAVANSTTYDFQYKVMSACGDDSVTVSLFVEDCDVSIREMSTGFISIYPNPTTGLIKVDDENVRGSISVEVYAGNGQLMISEQYAEGEEIRMDISEFATGIYTVKVNSSKGLDVKRIMKQ
ncbi:MAG: T9SS type A sorting domain-containing protein [Croceimicrobium sp.]